MGIEYIAEVLISVAFVGLFMNFISKLLLSDE